jgi:hypothetical protein
MPSLNRIGHFPFSVLSLEYAFGDIVVTIWLHEYRIIKSVIQRGDNFVTRVMGNKTSRQKNRTAEGGKDRGRRCGMTSFQKRSRDCRSRYMELVYTCLDFQSRFRFSMPPLNPPWNPPAEGGGNSDARIRFGPSQRSGNSQE